MALLEERLSLVQQMCRRVLSEKVDRARLGVELAELLKGRT